MEIKSKIFKCKTGKSKGKWIIRIEYFDDLLGKTRYMERHAEKRADATDAINKLVDDIKKSYGQIKQAKE